MFKNYIKIIFRIIARNKFYTILNISGLAVGLSCAALILLWVYNELSYDRYHEKADRIYRITKEDVSSDGSSAHWARCYNNWINNLPEEFPEIEHFVRLQQPDNISTTPVLVNNQKFYSHHFFKTDANIFSVFSFDLLKGDPNTALKEPNSIVLTEEMAHKCFGYEDPMGKTITVFSMWENFKKDYIVTGVLKNVPDNSHFQIDFLSSFNSPKERRGWAYIYVVLKEGVNPEYLRKKFPAFVKKHVERQDRNRIHLQPLSEIHLHSNLLREIEPNGNSLYVNSLSVTAILILILASINYMNLSTARTEKRAKEIGIRKVFGSLKRQLITYFLGESLIFTLIAFFIAVIIIELLIPSFNYLTGKIISIKLFGDLKFLLGLIGITLLTGLISGSYPALVLSSFKLISILKPTNIYRSFRGFSIRKLLVILQFTISISLIICTIIHYHQFKFLINKHSGHNEDQTIAVHNLPGVAKIKYFSFKEEILQHTGIIDVSAAMEEPSREIADRGKIYAEGIPEENLSHLYILPVDDNYIDFMGIEMICGDKSLASSRRGKTTNWRKAVEILNTSNRVYILNETAVKAIGWKSSEQVIGKQFSFSQSFYNLKRGPVIGVVKDFHQSSLHKKITPMVLLYEPIWFNSWLIKIRPENMRNTLAFIEKKWDEMFPEYPFEFDFIDDLFARLYTSEQSQVKLTGILSLIGIFIACLGLLGLTAFTAEKRTKEIGVRKVLGASISSIIVLLTKEFTKWVLLANIIAWPIAWYTMNKWLQNFAYRINIGIWTFLLAGALALVIALLTVSYQAIKAATANPVTSLRYE